MTTRNIAFSPVVRPGKGFNLFRIVLRADYDKNNKPTSFYTHTQTLLMHPDDESRDLLSYATGVYFPVHGDGEDDCKKAWNNFLKRSAKAMKEWPIASGEDFDRFMRCAGRKQRIAS